MILIYNRNKKIKIIIENGLTICTCKKRKEKKK